MKSYPVIIADNFFDDPDYVRDFALSLAYTTSSDGRWPGARSEHIHLLDNNLFNYVSRKIELLFSDAEPKQWMKSMQFQRISPYATDKWDRRNRGWVHCENATPEQKVIFGGLIYLTKDPEPDTGTSIYKAKKGFRYDSNECDDMKKSFYSGVDIDINEYNKLYDLQHEQYIETVKCENVYNRLIVFGSDVIHGAQTFGTKERLTLPFFGYQPERPLPPLMRF